MADSTVWWLAGALVTQIAVASVARLISVALRHLFKKRRPGNSSELAA